MNLVEEQEEMRKRASKQIKKQPVESNFHSTARIPAHQRQRSRKTSVFYIIQVIPRDKLRYKFGITINIENRLFQHKVLAPDCVLVRKYKCHPANEKLLLKIIEGFRGVAMIGSEVADVQDFDQLLSYFDALFKTSDMQAPQNDTHTITKDIASIRHLF